MNILEWKVGKLKDCPDILKDYFLRQQTEVKGTLGDTSDTRKVSFENGKFYKIIHLTDTYGHTWWSWKIPLDNNDSIVIEKDWGVEAKLLGGLFL